MNTPQRILFLIGLPASGKSTFARDLIRRDPSYKRVNKDDLRFMSQDGEFDQKQEEYILRLRDTLIRTALDAGFNVVVDDTNIAPKHWARINQLAREWSAANQNRPIVVEQHTMETPLEECLARNAKRKGREHVPEKVIRDMQRHLLKDRQGRPYRPRVEGLPECIVVDMDGTLSHLNGRNPYDAAGCINDPCNEPVLGLVHDLMREYAVIIVSAREDKDRAETEQWLRNHNVQYRALYMRRTGDKRNDAVVKPEIYEQHIFPHFNVKFVLDDRDRVVTAIRDMGVPVFQVAWGSF